MQPVIFEEALEEIVREHPQYDREAYHFLREALDHTQKIATQANNGKQRHVSGEELLNGIREYALDTYGPMTRMLFEEWGINRCEDFGEIVFNMVDHGLLGKTDNDCKEDFKSIYQFDEAFVHPFLPSTKLPAKAEKKPRETPANK